FPLAGLTGLLLLISAVGAAPAPNHVQASFVAADNGITPGKSLSIALRLVHDPHWPTYWLNPGTGLPTTVKWQALPAGRPGSDIRWPAPPGLKDRKGNVVGNGYEGDQLLPLIVTAPADAKPGEKIELQADVDWLMCEDVCIPGGAKLAISIAVLADAPKP